MESRWSKLNSVIEIVALCETNQKLYGTFFTIIQCNEHSGSYTGLDRPWELWEAERISRQHMNVARLSALRTARHYPVPQEIPLVLIFVRVYVDPQDH